MILFYLMITFTPVTQLKKRLYFEFYKLQNVVRNFCHLVRVMLITLYSCFW